MKIFSFFADIPLPTRNTIKWYNDKMTLRHHILGWALIFLLRLRFSPWKSLVFRAFGMSSVSLYPNAPWKWPHPIKNLCLLFNNYLSFPRSKELESRWQIFLPTRLSFRFSNWSTVSAKVILSPMTGASDVPCWLVLYPSRPFTKIVNFGALLVDGKCHRSPDVRLFINLYSTTNTATIDVIVIMNICVNKTYLIFSFVFECSDGITLYTSEKSLLLRPFSSLVILADTWKCYVETLA